MEGHVTVDWMWS